MKYFTNKETCEVYAYESVSDAEKFNSDFLMLSEISEDLFWSFKNPPPGGEWTVNGWVINDTLLAEYNENLIADADGIKKELLSEAAEAIAPLQDAVDLDMATPEEESALKEWKKYRVLLSRVDTSTAPDITWPVKP